MNDVRLVMFKDEERRDFTLEPGSTVIGRRHDCDLRVQTADVSRQHCEIVNGPNGVTVRDLESSNGTFVNGGQVSEHELEAGDRLRVGPAIFVVQIDGVPETISPQDTAVDLVDLGSSEGLTHVTPTTPAPEVSQKRSGGSSAASEEEPTEAVAPEPASAGKQADADDDDMIDLGELLPEDDEEDGEITLTEDDLFDLSDEDLDSGGGGDKKK